MSLLICKEIKLLAILAVALNPFVGAQQPVSKIDLNKETGSMDTVYAWFGCDKPNYTYMKDGKNLLSGIAALSPVRVRAHNLFTTCDGTAGLKQIAQLGKAGQLQQTVNRSEKIKKGLLQMNVPLPRQGIVFYKIQ
jgi:hypothetical protein